MKKYASILDYVNPGLDPAVWGQDSKLLPEHQKLILQILSGYIRDEKLVNPESWIEQIKIIGGITTYQYTFDSDIDIHIRVNLPAFIKSNKPEMTEEQVHEYLKEFRKRINEHQPKFPGTEHPIEYYFETPFVNPEGSPRSGLYDVVTGEWEKEPISIDKDFDVEEIKPIVIDIANEIAEEMDVSFGTIKRHIRRMEELQYIRDAWTDEQKSTYDAKLQEKLQIVEEEIKSLSMTRDQIVLDRRNYNPEGDNEIKFKYLQKFGYLTIITELQELLKDDNKITEDEIPEVKMILDEADTKPEARLILGEDSWPGQSKLIIDFDNTITDNSNVDYPNIGEPFDGVKEALEELKENGWTLNIFSARSNDKYGTKQIKEFMEEHDLPYDEIVEGKPHAEYYIDDRAVEFLDWKQVLKDVKNRTKKSSLVIKKADFMPSISTHSPTNKLGPDDTVIPVDPDAAAEEETYYAPWADKPRDRKWWKRILDFFKSPKEDKLEEEASKFFEDKPKKTPKPKTTWDEPRQNRPKQDLEPFKPLPTTFQHTTNEENLNWRYPNKFMKRPRGPNYSNTGDVLDILISKYDNVEKDASVDKESSLKSKLPSLIKQFIKNFPNTEPEQAETIITQLNTADPTQTTATYTDWILNQYIKDQNLDVQRVQDVLLQVDKAKKNNMSIDFFSYDLDGLEQEVQPMIEQIDQQSDITEQKQVKNLPGKIIYEEAIYKVLEIEDPEEIVELCSSTLISSWCVKDISYATNYAPMFFFIKGNSVIGAYSKKDGYIRDRNDNATYDPVLMDLLFKVTPDIEDRAKLMFHNPHTSPEDILKIVKQKDFPYREQFVRHDNIPEEALAILSTEEDLMVRYRVAGNAKTSPETLLQLSKDLNYEIRYVVAENDNAPSEALAILSTDEDTDTRRSVAVAPNTTQETLLKLIKDREVSVRFNVASNANISTELLELLSKDTHQIVKDKANEKLINRDTKTSKKASTYTDQEMEKYYTEQHEIADDPNQGGGFTPRDWNHSTTDFPKPEDLERYKVRLDIMMKPIHRKNPMQDTPPYEVTYFFGLPSGAYHGDY